MALSRRFQNMILWSPYAGAMWLRPVDLASQLFYDDTATPTGGDGSEPAAADDAGGFQKNRRQEEATPLQMEKMRIPSSPIFRFQATPPANRGRLDLQVFPLPDRKVVIADQTGRAFHWDADTRTVVTMPNLHKAKLSPVSFFFPSADDGDDRRGSGRLYVMESIPNAEKVGSVEPSEQFEVFVRGKDTWHCRRLLPPPFVRDPAGFTYQRIASFAVVGSNVWISTWSSGRHPGTYCLDTTSNTWSEESGKWALPFCGKAEYVPELKLWFGLSADDGRLVAADLSAMDSQKQPVLVVSFQKEFDPPEEWEEYRDPQLVNLGSGRFCVARFFVTSIGTYKGGYGVEDPIYRSFVVFTGVEVNDGSGSCCYDDNNANGKVKLRMIKHKSRRTSRTRSHVIEAVL